MPKTASALPLGAREYLSDLHSRFAPLREGEQARYTPAPLTVADFRGRVLVVYAFQMLCPGCVAHSIPQAKRVHEAFAAEQVAVVGLHTVFEHHAVMGPEALEVFIHEYRLRFPVGVDEAGSDGSLPKTMARMQMRGTPTLLVVDRQGELRLNHFGAVDDLQLGALIGQCA